MDAGEWDELFEDVVVTPDLAKAWLHGIGYNHGAPPEVLIRLFGLDHRVDFLWRRDLAREVFDAAVACPVRRVFVTAAETGSLDDEQWERLVAALPPSPLRNLFAELADEHARLRGRRSGRSADDPRRSATPEEIAALAAGVPDIAADDLTHVLPWIEDLHRDADAMRQLASFPNLWIRRSVARARHLPPDVVGLLAHDEDRVVRLFLSESCDDAPADMLVEVWSWWEGSLSFPGRPLNHPNFPREGLLRFADDPDPRMRLLALRDPASTAELVEVFTWDAAVDVRAEAGGDPRLSPEAAARLVADESSTVRQAATTNPVIPGGLLIGLLRSEQTADIAARNPAVPTDVLHRMIDLAGPVVGAATPHPDFRPIPSPSRH